MIDTRTVFLGGSVVTEINCSHPSSGPHIFMWYHNGELLENYTSSSLTLNSEGRANLTDVFGVYQCFCTVSPYSVEEITITRVLPFGKEI